MHGKNGNKPSESPIFRYMGKISPVATIFCGAPIYNRKEIFSNLIQLVTTAAATAVVVYCSLYRTNTNSINCICIMHLKRFFCSLPPTYKYADKLSFPKEKIEGHLYYGIMTSSLLFLSRSEMPATCDLFSFLRAFTDQVAFFAF